MNTLGPSEAVRRALARDDLIMMATDADKAVDIVRMREALARKSEDEKSLFSVALEHYLRAAENEQQEWAVRASAWKHAGVIVRFGELVGISATMPHGRSYTAAQLHTNSLRQLDDQEAAGEPAAEPLDLTLHAFHRYRAARTLRLDGRFAEALELSLVSTDALNASGAEPHMAHLMYEASAAHISRGQAHLVEDLLKEREAYFTTTRAAGYSTRYRFDFIRAVAQWDTGDDGVRKGLQAALAHARRDRLSTATDDDDRPAPEGGLELLSVMLTMAEFLAANADTDQDRTEAVELGRQALLIADEIRGRWRVIARSRAPLAVVFQRVYGDIALLAATVPGPEAAELGLRVALSAKQTGFAARMRTGHRLMSPEVERILKAIIDVESGPRTSMPIDYDIDTKLARLRFELREAVSTMLADTILPPPAELSTLTKVIGTRYALDYVELTDSLGKLHLFRSLIRPGNRISFERFTPDPYYAKFFAHAGEQGNLAALLDLALVTRAEPNRDLESASRLSGADRRAAGDAGAFDWQVLAERILPAELRTDLAAKPVELVISAHSWLSLVPWPALRITLPSGGSVRLVERATITQTPAFTCLHYGRPPTVNGRALVRLVGADEGGVDVTAERGAWGMDAGTTGIPLSACDVASRAAPQPLRVLEDAIGRWGFVHFAAHGDGRGLRQRLNFPEEPLSFRHALVLKWPASVLIASCHVGLVLNVTEAEPLNLVMGLLSGGARCVVAGIASIDDKGTGEAASRIVRAIRERQVSLEVALRDAQLEAVREGAPERQWALLAAYTQ